MNGATGLLPGAGLRNDAPIMLAVIGGTGLYRLAGLHDVATLQPETAYGMTSGPIRVGTLAGSRVAFLARHGEAHALPPHLVNYRANLAALHALGVTRVLALNTVGGITERFGPRVLACPDQLIDYTWGRESTFRDGGPRAGEDEILHVDFGDPYTPGLRTAVVAAARRSNVALVDGGCYGATQGPRLETRAEIARMRRDGCDLVGMTGMPEAGLARELGMDYACLAIVANWAAGAGPDASEVITLDDVLANVAAASAGLPDLVGALADG